MNAITIYKKRSLAVVSRRFHNRVAIEEGLYRLEPALADFSLKLENLSEIFYALAIPATLEFFTALKKKRISWLFWVREVIFSLRGNHGTKTTIED